MAEPQSAQAHYENKIGKILVEQHVISQEESDLCCYAAETAAAQVTQAQKQLRATAIDLECLTVRAPVDGQQMDVYIDTSVQTPLAPITAGPPKPKSASKH